MADIMNLIPQILQTPQTQNPIASEGTQNLFRSLTQGTGECQNPEVTTLSFMELLFGKLLQNSETPEDKNDGSDDAVFQQMSLLATQLITAAPAQSDILSNETTAPAQEAALAAVAAGCTDMDVNGQSALPETAGGHEAQAAQPSGETRGGPYHTQNDGFSVLVQEETAPFAPTAVPMETEESKGIPVTVDRQTAVRDETGEKGRETAGQSGVQLLSKTVSFRQAALMSQSGADGGETGGQEQEDESRQPMISSDGEAPDLPQTIQPGAAGQTVEVIPAAAAEIAETPLSGTAQLIDRLVQSVSLATGDGESRIELNLEPAFLGRLSVTLTAGADGGVKAQLMSADPAVRGLLTSNVEQLKSALLECGVNLQGIDISGGTAQRQTADGRGGNQDRRRESRTGTFALSGASASVYGKDYAQDYAAAGVPSNRNSLYGTVEFSA